MFDRVLNKHLSQVSVNISFKNSDCWKRVNYAKHCTHSLDFGSDVTTAKDFVFLFFSWLYRIMPAAKHKPFEKFLKSEHFNGDWNNREPNPNQVSVLPK